MIDLEKIDLECLFFFNIKKKRRTNFTWNHTSCFHYDGFRMRCYSKLQLNSLTQLDKTAWVLMHDWGPHPIYLLLSVSFKLSLELPMHFCSEFESSDNFRLSIWLSHARENNTCTCTARNSKATSIKLSSIIELRKKASSYDVSEIQKEQLIESCNAVN